MPSFPEAWRDPVRRREVLDAALRDFHAELAAEGFPFQIRFLGPADEADLCALSIKVTQQTPAFTAVFRLTPPQMERYWSALGRVLLRDRESFAVGISHQGRLLAVASCGTVAFPSAWNTVKFLAAMLVGLGPVGLWRYLAGILGYEKLLELSSEEKGSTLRFIWLYADPDRHGASCGSALCRCVIRMSSRLGFRRIQAAVDAADRPLNRFYRRLGAVLGRRATMSGVEVVETLRPLDAEKA